VARDNCKIDTGIMSPKVTGLHESKKRAHVVFTCNLGLMDIKEHLKASSILKN
jgi:hypothetical protein